MSRLSTGALRAGRGIELGKGSGKYQVFWNTPYGCPDRPAPAPGDGWILEQATTTVHNKVNENGCNVSSLRNFSTSTRFPAQATVAA